ncbi:MAG: hypothetical protein WCT08_01080 [Patescibacteria group bacterium]|jgi:hypothetical protein
MALLTPEQEAVLRAKVAERFPGDALQKLAADQSLAPWWNGVVDRLDSAMRTIDIDQLASLAAAQNKMVD